MSDTIVIPRDVFYQVTILATVLAGFAYGLVVSLYIFCFRALLKGEIRHSRQRRRILRGYITFMVLLSTLALIQDMSASIFDVSILPLRSSGLSSVVQSSSRILPFTIWGADGFKMWRCTALYYRGVSGTTQVVLIGLLGFLGLSSLDPVLGTLFLVSQFFYHPAGVLRFMAMPYFMLGLSAVSNFIMSILITFRIVYHQRQMRSVFGDGLGSLYTRIVVMCIESCTLIVIPSLVFMGLYSRQANGYQISLFLLPHFCVMSPLLLVYRVVDGRDASTTFKLSETQGSPGKISRFDLDVHFKTQVSTYVGQELFSR